MPRAGTGRAGGRLCSGHDRPQPRRHPPPALGRGDRRRRRPDPAQHPRRRLRGPVWPVDPDRPAAEGLPTVPGIADLPATPDVAIVALPPPALPEAIAALGARGCRLAVVTTPGATAERQAMLDAARPHLLRIVGPGSFGLIVPGVRLNASLAYASGAAGRLALLAQSGAVAAAMVDWAAERGIGFSRVVSLGAMADADAGDFLDLLAMDGATRAILLQLETIPAPRKFLSAARAAARLKPVIALKAGRTREAAEAALTHTGALAGADAVIDAALRRAGILRVRGLAEIFAAAETVGRFRPLARARLAIVTNGGGPVCSPPTGSPRSTGRSPRWRPRPSPRCRRPARRRTRSTCAPRPPAALRRRARRAGRRPRRRRAARPARPSVLSDPLAVAHAVAGRVSGGLIGGKPVFACWMGGAPPATPAGRCAPAASPATTRRPTPPPRSATSTDWGRAQAALLHVPDRSARAGRNERRGPRPSRGGHRAAARAGAAHAQRARGDRGARRLRRPASSSAARRPPRRSAPRRRRCSPPAAGSSSSSSRPRSCTSPTSAASPRRRHPRRGRGRRPAIAARAAAAGVTLDGFAVQPMIRRPRRSS